MLRQISLASTGIVVGGILTVAGFIAYAIDNPTLNLAGFFYGVPLLLGGLAFKITELKPVPLSQPTTPEVLDLRKQQATKTQNQVRSDVTRYRYGQKAHLDAALAHLGLSPTDDERPVIAGLRESQIDGSYALTLEFFSPLISWDAWEQKREKMEKFFGPGVQVTLDQPEPERVDVSLVTQPAQALAAQEA
jgi:hypothetical protein